MNRLRLTKNEFLKNIDDVVAYIKCIEEQTVLFEQINSNNIALPDIYVLEQRFRKISTTPVTYNAVIISLYGCYESYIDKISGTLLDFLVSKIKHYDALPESIKNKHIKKSGEFLSNPQRFRNFEITEQTIIKNLHMCLEKQEDFLLNKELLLTHNGNLGINQLMELLNDLGLQNCKGHILSNEKYIKYVSEKYELSINNAKIYIHRKNQESEDSLFKELVQLIEQRNKVAHGWCVDTRLSYNVLTEEIIPFMKMLGHVIGDIFEEEFINILKRTNSLKQFGSAIQVYNNRVLCINCKDAKLKRGDFIYGYNQNKYVALNILELQHNNQNIEEICEENIDIGILVDSDIKENWIFYYT